MRESLTTKTERQTRADEKFLKLKDKFAEMDHHYSEGGTRDMLRRLSEAWEWLVITTCEVTAEQRR